MALTTYGGLIEAIPSWSTYSDVGDEIPDFVAWAHQEICRRLRANVMLVSGDLSISAETIAAPTGFLAFKRLYLDTSPRKFIRTTSAEGAMDLSATLVTGQYPTHVALEGALLRFAPIFTWTGTGKALYYAEPDALVDDADTNAVMTKYPYLYLWGALEALHAFKEDADMERSFGQRFTDLIEDINTRDAKDTTSVAVQMQPYAGGVV